MIEFENQLLNRQQNSDASYFFELFLTRRSHLGMNTSNSMIRVYAESYSTLRVDEPILLDSAESKHLIRVRRNRQGDQVQVLNGRGLIAEAVIEVDDPKGTQLRTLKVHQVKRADPSIALCLSITKASTFEMILQKATELGVDEIYPFISAHSEAIHQLDKLERKFERWNQITVEALKQSGNPFLPRIHPPQEMQDLLLERRANTTIYFALTKNSLNPEALRKRLKIEQNIDLWVGPEGDFSTEEYSLFNERKETIPLTLAPTVLRMETAAIVGLGMVQSWFRT